ncbi:hypothetical protein PWT90_05380 [Aphanocladium album]|nr:hypothetical protein PWT90_05380 [Aphanocladium album]
MDQEIKPIAATYPPLHRATSVLSSSVVFALDLAIGHVLEQDVANNWDAQLRYCPVGSDLWQEVSLVRHPLPFLTSRSSTSPHLSFSATVNLPAAVKFTVQFRNDTGTWMTAGHDGPDSFIVPWDRSGLVSQDIDDYVQIMNPDLRITNLGDTKEPGAKSWLLEAPVLAADGDAPHMDQVMLGKPFAGEFLKWFALARHTASWLAPRQGTTHFKLDVASVLCSFVDRRGRHLITLGVSGFRGIMSIFGDNNEGALMVKIRNDRQAPGFGRVIISVANDFETALSNALTHSRAFFLSDYSPGETLAQFGKLADRGVAPSTLFLEDCCEQDRKTGIFVGPCNASLGLEIAKTRKQYPAIRNVIYRHSLLASAPEFDSARKDYKVTSVLYSVPGGATAKTSLVAAEDAHQFYDDYYRFLRSSGVDAVQVDNIQVLETLSSAAMRACFTESYLDAQHTASMVHFAEGYMTSRALSPNPLFRNSKWPLALSVVQNSGWFPDYRKLVFVNSCNALLSRAIGNIPYWDTVLINSTFDLAARVISGGPIKVGSEDEGNCLKRVCGLTARGKTVVLRPSGIGGATDPYASFEDPVLVRMGNTHAIGEGSVSILGLFNATEKRRLEMLRASDFPHLGCRSDTYIIRSSSGTIFDTTAPFSISVGVSEFDILCAYPLTILDMPVGPPLRVVVLGISDKELGVAAIIDASVVLDNDELQISAVLKILGVLEVYVAGASQKNLDRIEVTIQGRSFNRGVEILNDVVRVDLEALLANYDLDSETDEVYVKITFRWV